MYNPKQDKVQAWVHDRVHENNFEWFTVGEVARGAKVSVPTARKYVREFAGKWKHLIDVTWEDYRPNSKVQLFRIVAGK